MVELTIVCLRRFLYLIGFLMTLKGSLSADVKINETDDVTLDFQMINNCYFQAEPISVVNKNNVTVATCSQQNSSMNQAIFSERYSIKNSSNYIKIHIENTTIFDAGTYSCINSSQFIPDCSINLLVFRKPEPPRIKLTSIPDIGGTVTLLCEGSSRSAPAEYFQGQSMIYQWYVNNVSMHTGRSYTVILDDNLRNKEISCTVRDTDGHGIQSDASEPLILLPKDTATLLDIGPSWGPDTYKVLEGANLTLECFESRTRTPPISTYIWTHDGEPLLGKDGKTLVIARVDINDAGTYECQARNSEGRSNTVNKTVEVLEGPVLTSVEQIETSGEGRVELTCISLVVTQDIVWFESGSMDILHVGSTFNTRVTKSTKFTCQVSAILTPTNGSPVIKGANSTITVIYKYPPIRKTQPLQRRITFDRYIGHQFEETIEYDAHPEVTNASLRALNGPQATVKVQLIGNTVKIITGHLAREDCTFYKMVVQNTVGSDSIDINIRCYPLAPSDLTATLSGGQVTLEWTPGYNGGQGQVFKVHLSLDGKIWRRYYSSHNKNEETGKIGAVVKDLSPEKTYLFKVVADNGLSSGDSNIAFTSPRKEAVSDSGSVIGGTISGVIIFIVIAIGIYIYYRYQYLPAHRHQKKTGTAVKESDYERPVTRPTDAGNDLEDYDTIQRCQYENMTYAAKSEYIGGIHSDSHYENLKQTMKPAAKPVVKHAAKPAVKPVTKPAAKPAVKPMVKPNIMPKPVQPKKPHKPNKLVI